MHVCKAQLQDLFPSLTVLWSLEGLYLVCLAGQPASWAATGRHGWNRQYWLWGLQQLDCMGFTSQPGWKFAPSQCALKEGSV